MQYQRTLRHLLNLSLPSIIIGPVDVSMLTRVYACEVPLLGTHLCPGGCELERQHSLAIGTCTAWRQEPVDIKLLLRLSLG